MQNVVDVACQSPPSVMTATKKPAVQSAQASDQDPFGLVLQKVSESIDKNQCSDACKSSEFSKDETESELNSTEKKSVSSSDNEKEVTKTNSKENENKLEDKDDNTEKEDCPLDESIFQSGIGFLVPQQVVKVESATAQENSTVETLQNGFATVNTAANEPLVLEQPAPLNAMPDGIEGSESLATTDINFDSVVTAKMEEPQISGDPTKGLTQETSLTQEKLPKEQMNAVDTVNPSEQGSEITLDQDQKLKVNQTEVNPTNQMSLSNQTAVEKGSNATGKSTEISESSSDAAPPDAATQTESAAAPPTVQTSQINEPARLAEAPKNEVVTQIGTQIDQMVKTNQSSLRLQLYPEELGHIDLKIVTTKSGIGVTMIADSASTQEILKSEMNSLKQNMQEAGIQLSNLHIGQGQNSNQQQSFEERQKLNTPAYRATSTTGLNSSGDSSPLQLQTSAIDYLV